MLTIVAIFGRCAKLLAGFAVSKKSGIGKVCIGLMKNKKKTNDSALTGR